MTIQKPFENQLIIICGLSFSGKSTLGKAIKDRFGYEEVDVDETKFDLYGKSIRDEELNHEDWVRIYTETDRRIADFLRSGRTVVDASRNFSKGERDVARSIAENAGVPLVTIYVNTPEEIVRRRLHRNRREPSRRDIPDRDFEDVVRAMQVPGAEEDPLVFHYVEDPARWVEENAGRLAPE